LVFDTVATPLYQLGSPPPHSLSLFLSQVLQDRGEANSRHGRATFSVLLLQDLAVVLVSDLFTSLSQWKEP
jgi:Kef-type K+ transport system membrane component KefB